MTQARVDKVLIENITELPDELLLMFFSHLIPTDLLLGWSYVCSRFNTVVLDDNVWQVKAQLHFPQAARKLSHLLQEKELTTQRGCWLNLYKEQQTARKAWFEKMENDFPGYLRMFEIMTEGDYTAFLLLPRYEYTVFFEQDHQKYSCSELAIKSGSQPLLDHLYSKVLIPAASLQRVSSRNGQYRQLVPPCRATFSAEGDFIDEDGRSKETLLYFAIAYGQPLAEIARLLNDGSYIDEKWLPDGMQPIHAAASVGRIDVIQYVMNIYGNLIHLDAADDEDYTPLYYATCNNQLAMVEFLIEKKVSIHGKNIQTNLTPLECALQDGHIALVESLLKRNANPLIDSRLIRDSDWEMVEAMVPGILLVLDDITLIEVILNIKPELLHWKSVSSLTLLDYAIWGNHLNAVRYFMDKEVSYNEKILLKVAATMDILTTPNVFTYFNKKNPSLLEEFDEIGNSIFHLAIVKSKFNTARAIFGLKPTLAARMNQAGDLPLHRLLILGQGQFFENFPPDALPQLEHIDAKGDNIMHVAAQMGAINFMEHIFKLCPALATKRNDAGKPPLHLVPPNKWRDNAFSLLSPYSSVFEETDAIGNNLLHIVFEYSAGYRLTVREEYRSSINAVNHAGKTPLQCISDLPTLCSFVDKFFDSLNRDNHLFVLSAALTYKKASYLTPDSTYLFSESVPASISLITRYLTFNPELLFQARRPQERKINDLVCIRLFLSDKQEMQESQSRFLSAVLNTQQFVDKELLELAHQTASHRWWQSKDEVTENIFVGLLIKYPELKEYELECEDNIFLQAIKENNHELMKRLIKENMIAVDNQFYYGIQKRTLLYHVIYEFDKKRCTDDNYVQSDDYRTSLHFIDWLVRHGANIYFPHNDNATPASILKDTPLLQASLFGRQFSLVDRKELDQYEWQMRSPLIMAISKHQDFLALTHVIEGKPERAMVKALATYLNDRYHDRREYFHNFLCFFGLGCSRLEKIQATLALIDAITRKQDLLALSNQAQYRNALHNGRLGKLYKQCLNSIPLPTQRFDDLQRVEINF